MGYDLIGGLHLVMVGSALGNSRRALMQRLLSAAVPTNSRALMLMSAVLISWGVASFMRAKRVPWMAIH
jgi:hypothetical protein